MKPTRGKSRRPFGAIGAVEDVAIDSGRGLAGGGDAVGGVLHECGEFFHGGPALMKA